MIKFKNHEIIKKENDYVEIILHLDPGTNFSEEFSKELGHRGEQAEIHKAAENYVKEKLPNTRFNKIKVMVGGLVIATMLGATLVVPGGGQASAASTTSDVAIQGGQLAVDSLTVGTFTLIKLTGGDQSTSVTINPFNVTDPTGTGEGWNVVMSASQFTDGTGNTLPMDSLSIATPTVAIAEGAAGSSPINTIRTDTGTIDNTTGVKILSAGANGGMGTYTVSFPENALTLNLKPKDVKAGTYTSTIKVEINTGP